MSFRSDVRRQNLSVSDELSIERSSKAIEPLVLIIVDNHMYLYIICILSAFIGGLFAREVFDIVKTISKNLRSVRVEIDLGRDSTIPTENDTPQKLPDNQAALILSSNRRPKDGIQKQTSSHSKVQRVGSSYHRDANDLLAK